MEFLLSLWTDTKKVSCCYQCHKPIELQQTLIRTFKIHQGESDSMNATRIIDIPSLEYQILLYDRHKDCLVSSVKYVTVSHVWHPEVSQLQFHRNEYKGSAVDISEVQKLVCESPVRIYLGLQKEIKEPFELWHDYFSVPQWSDSRKMGIIVSIPHVYRNSQFTLVHLSDVSFENFATMRSKSSVKEICVAISNICNSKWFSRVWTTMEFTQSRNLRAMVKGFTLIEKHPDDIPFVLELRRTWGTQIPKKASTFTCETYAGMGYNLVPWQLGPTTDVRDQIMRGKPTSFAQGFLLLSRRCVTHERDFFHGLLGVLDIKLRESELDVNPKTALLQIAQHCISRADFSPLLMVPASSQKKPSDYDMRSLGYYDLIAFNIGDQRRSPEFPNVSFSNGNPIIKTMCLGKTRFIRRTSGSEGMPDSIARTIRDVLNTVGNNIDRFMSNMSRLYGQHPTYGRSHTEKHNYKAWLQHQLNQITASQSAVSRDLANRITVSLGLHLNPRGHWHDVSPAQLLNEHGITMHLESASALVAVTCPRCAEPSVLRVGLLQHQSQLAGGEAHRFPGLQYSHTLAGGTGIIVKDGRSLARFVWGAPLCGCRVEAETQFVLDGLPMPMPNKLHYGFPDKRGNPIPVSIGRLIKV